MQHRYAGGIGDFFKFGLLRWLTVPSPFVQPLRLGVISFRIVGESQHEVAHTAYLDRSSATGQDLRPLDPELYDRLVLSAESLDGSMQALMSSGLLPSDAVTYDCELCFADLSPHDRAGRRVRRERLFHDALVAVEPCSLVFVDPDSGLHHVDRAAPRHLAHADDDPCLSEVGRLLERSQSVVVTYRSDASGPIPDQAMASMIDLHESLGVEPLAVVTAARASAPLFIVVPAPEHRSDLEASLGALQLSSWGDELRLYRWRNAALTV